MAVTNEGINSLLNTMFKGAAQVTTWYTNVFCADYTPLPATPPRPSRRWPPKQPRRFPKARAKR